jgi:hypothetical protein
MALTDRAASALGWAFGAIQSAAYQGLTTTQVWESLRDAAEAHGLPTLGLSAADVSSLRGYAGQIRQASESLAAADPGLGLDASMVGVAPWSMGSSTLAVAPEYWARVEMTVADEQGNLSTGWTTMTGITSLNMTAGELNAMIQANAEAAAIAEGTGKTPRGSLVSTGRIELLVAPQA